MMHGGSLRANAAGRCYLACLQIFLHDYLMKWGYGRTAETFRREAQVTRLPDGEYDLYPNGFLCDLWTSFYTFQQQRSSTLALLWDYAPQILRERYVPKFLEGFRSNNALLACDFSSDGKIVASGGFEGKAFLCYMDTCDSVTTSEAHSANISDVKFQPGSFLFATSSADKTVKLWDAARPGKSLFTLVGHNGWVRTLDFHPTGRALASSDSIDVIELWNVNQGVRLANFTAGGQRVRFQPQIGRLLAIANGKVINILDIRTWGVQNCLQGHRSDIRSMCWDINGQMIASVSEDSARVWSVMVHGYCLYQLDSNGMKFQSITFHPKYHNFLIIGGLQFMQVWIPENGNVYTIPATNASITGLAASTQTKFVASASSDSMVKIWQ